MLKNEIKQGAISGEASLGRSPALATPIEILNGRGIANSNTAPAFSSAVNSISGSEDVKAIQTDVEKLLSPPNDTPDRYASAIFQTRGMSYPGLRALIGDDAALSKAVFEERYAKIPDFVQSAIRTSTAVLQTQFQRSVQATYMQRNLSMQYFMADEMHKTRMSLADLGKVLESKLEAIKINTSASDARKATMSQKIKEALRTRTANFAVDQIVRGRNALVRFATGHKFEDLPDIATDWGMRRLEEFRQGGTLSDMLTTTKMQAGGALSHLAGRLRESAEIRPEGAPKSMMESLANTLGRGGEYLSNNDIPDSVKERIDRIAERVQKRYQETQHDLRTEPITPQSSYTPQGSEDLDDVDDIVKEARTQSDRVERAAEDPTDAKPKTLLGLMSMWHKEYTEVNKSITSMMRRMLNCTCSGGSGGGGSIKGRRGRGGGLDLPTIDTPTPDAPRGGGSGQPFGPPSLRPQMSQMSPMWQTQAPPHTPHSVGDEIRAVGAGVSGAHTVSGAASLGSTSGARRPSIENGIFHGVHGSRPATPAEIDFISGTRANETRARHLERLAAGGSWGAETGRLHNVANTAEYSTNAAEFDRQIGRAHAADDILKGVGGAAVGSGILGSAGTLAEDTLGIGAEAAELGGGALLGASLLSGGKGKLLGALVSRGGGLVSALPGLLGKGKNIPVAGKLFGVAEDMLSPLAKTGEVLSKGTAAQRALGLAKIGAHTAFNLHNPLYGMRAVGGVGGGVKDAIKAAMSSGGAIGKGAVTAEEAAAAASKVPIAGRLLSRFTPKMGAKGLAATEAFARHMAGGKGVVGSAIGAGLHRFAPAGVTKLAEGVAASRMGGTLLKLGAFAGRANLAGLAMAAGGALGTATDYMDPHAGIVNTTGHMASGALSGAGIGALIGSIVPGVGTALGAGVGAVGGALWQAAWHIHGLASFIGETTAGAAAGAGVGSVLFGPGVGTALGAAGGAIAVNASSIGHAFSALTTSILGDGYKANDAGVPTSLGKGGMINSFRSYLFGSNGYVDPQTGYYMPPKLSMGDRLSEGARHLFGYDHYATNKPNSDMGSYAVQTSDIDPNDPNLAEHLGKMTIGANGFVNSQSLKSRPGKFQKDDRKLVDQPEYIAVMKKLPGEIQKYIQQSQALEFMAWSTSVQSGADNASKIIIDNYKPKQDVKTFIKRVYSSRSEMFGGVDSGLAILGIDKLGKEQKFTETQQDDINNGRSAASFNQDEIIAGSQVGSGTDQSISGASGYSETTMDIRHGPFDVNALPNVKPLAISSEQTKQRIIQAMRYFIGQGWTQAQAAGIVANLARESQMNETAVGDKSSRGGALGIAQWHLDRRNAIAAAFKKPFEKLTFEDQLAAVQWEMTQGGERKAGNRLRNAKDAKTAGAIVSEAYERPADTDGEAALRGSTAVAYAKQFGSAATDNVAATPASGSTTPATQTEVAAASGGDDTGSSDSGNSGVSTPSGMDNGSAAASPTQTTNPTAASLAASAPPTPTPAAEPTSKADTTSASTPVPAPQAPTPGSIPAGSEVSSSGRYTASSLENDPSTVAYATATAKAEKLRESAQSSDDRVQQAAEEAKLKPSKSAEDTARAIMSGMPSMIPTADDYATAGVAAPKVNPMTGEAMTPTPTIKTPAKPDAASKQTSTTVIAPITHNNTVVHVPKSGISMSKKAP